MQEVDQKLLSFAKATSDETIFHKLEKPFLPIISKNPERLVSLLYVVVNDPDPQSQSQSY
jgi:hypothetical protein